MEIPRRTKRLLLGGILAALMTGLWFWLGPEPPQVQQLPDGSVLTLLQVDYGTNCIFVDGNWMQKHFRRWLPAKPTTIRGLNVGAPNLLIHTNATPQLVFWIRRTSVPDDSSMNLNVDRVVAVDESNRRFFLPRDATNEEEGDWDHLTNGIVPVPFSVFPRDGTIVRLQILYSRGWEIPNGVLAEFATRNPTPGPHPVWQPQPLPITSKSGSTEITLTDLKIVPSPHPGDESTTDKACAAKFRVVEKEVVSHDWSPQEVIVSDTGGNSFSFYGPDQEDSILGRRLEVDYGTDSLPEGLDPKKPWKLHVEFIRTNSFPPGEIGTFRLSVADDKARRVDLATAVNDVTVRLKTFSIREIKKGFDGINLNLDLKTPHGRKFLTLISVVDDQGTNHPVDEGVGPKDLFTEGILGNCALPPNARSLTVTFAVSQTVSAEFIAQPIWAVPTNAPAPAIEK